MPNTAKITNAYDNVARLTGTHLVNNSGTVLNSHEYLYNVGNQRIRHTRTDASYYTNTYDAIGQLRWADSTVASEDRGYLYDAAWNLTKRANNATRQTFGVNAKNELTNGPTVTAKTDFVYDGLRKRKKQSRRNGMRSPESCSPGDRPSRSGARYAFLIMLIASFICAWIFDTTWPFAIAFLTLNLLVLLVYARRGRGF